MNNNEKIQRAEQLIAEANALLNEVKAVYDNEEDVIAKYKNDYYKNKQYYLNNNSEVDFVNNGDSFEQVIEFCQSPYQHYLTEEIAEQAKKLKDFNDKLLAFKYCYDLYYKPVFSGDYDNRAYFVHYDSDDGEYTCDWESVLRVNTVYFSSEEIAQKCCDWLNSFKEEM